MPHRVRSVADAPGAYLRRHRRQGMASPAPLSILLLAAVMLLARSPTSAVAASSSMARALRQSFDFCPVGQDLCPADPLAGGGLSCVDLQVRLSCVLGSDEDANCTALRGCRHAVVVPPCVTLTHVVEAHDDEGSLLWEQRDRQGGLHQ